MAGGFLGGWVRSAASASAATPATVIAQISAPSRCREPRQTPADRGGLDVSQKLRLSAERSFEECTARWKSTSTGAPGFANIFLSGIVGGTYTTITAEVGFSAGSEIEVHWTILAFQAGANVNVQQVEAIVADTVTTNTITAVDPAKTVIWPMGIGHTKGGASVRSTSGWIELTDSTTVTTRRSTGDPAALHQWINILEWN